MEYRSGIDVMTTEAACLSSIWPTDGKVRDWMALHGRPQDYRPLTHDAPACYDSLIKVDLDKIESMIALPFHPSNALPIAEVNRNAREILEQVDREIEKQFGTGTGLRLRDKVRNGAVLADQGIIAGCAGGSFENLTLTAAVLDGKNTGNQAFSLSVYPASVPQSLGLVHNMSAARLMVAGAIIRSAFCGPCFGAGDTPANGTLSIRHTTRNFPNREGSKPGNGQFAAVALMDARSIAATAANGGILTPATDLDWESIAKHADLTYTYNPRVYAHRVYNGFGTPQPETPLAFGPNIADWPAVPALPEHLLLRLASVITDPVTTTDELIPSGETSSLRSNPLKLAEYTLSRKDPGYVGRAREMQTLEQRRRNNPADAELLAILSPVCTAAGLKATAESLARTGIGSAIFAVRPGDGSAREQAASSQKVLGGWANLALEYATRRYRSNLVNWGMLPFIVEEVWARKLRVGDWLLIPNVRALVEEKREKTEGVVVSQTDGAREAETISLALKGLTDDERSILLDGCLINFYNQRSMHPA
jgi:aconitate hydratase